MLCRGSMKMTASRLLVCFKPVWAKPLSLHVHRNTIWDLWRRYQQFGHVGIRPRAGRPRVTSRQQDNHIRLVHLRNRFQTANLNARTIPGLLPISPRTVRNRLLERESVRDVLQPAQFFCVAIV